MSNEKLDAFILRAGFTFGWRELESWGRRMAERAVEELAEAERKLPCGHHHSLDDSYGGCVLCITIASHAQMEDELAAAQRTSDSADEVQK